MVRKYTALKPRTKKEPSMVYYLEPKYTTYWNESDLKNLLKELKFVAEYSGGTNVGLIKFKDTDEKVPSFRVKSLFMLQQITQTLWLRGTRRWSNPPVVKRKTW